MFSLRLAIIAAPPSLAFGRRKDFAVARTSGFSGKWNDFHHKFNVIFTLQRKFHAKQQPQTNVQS